MPSDEGSYFCMVSYKTSKSTGMFVKTISLKVIGK